MREIPLDVMLSWPVPNYVNPVTRGPGLLIVNIIMITLVTITVLLRLYTRMIMLRWFGIDDLFIIGALISTLGMTVAVILANVDYGWDRHIWDLRVDQFAPAMKMAFAAKMIFSAAATFTRLSLLTFYYRLVQDSSIRWFRWILHVSTFINAMTLPFLVLITIFQCSPIRAYWTYPILPNQKCISEGKLTLGCGVVNTFLDLLTTTIPIPLIINLQLPLRRRLGAIVLVSLGLIVTIAGAVRTYYTWQGLLASYDQTWYSYGLWISAAIEIDLGVICACAPALRLLFVKKIGTQQLSSFGSYIGRRAGSSKLSHMLSSISSLRQWRRERSAVRSITVPKEKELDDSELSGNVNRENHDPGYLWEEPWSGDNAPKPIRISTAIPSGMMSPIKDRGTSFEMMDRGFGNTTTATTGLKSPTVLSQAVNAPQNWPLMTPVNNEQQIQAAADMRKHTGFNFNIEHQPALEVLDEMATEEEEQEFDGKQSVEIRELDVEELEEYNDPVGSRSAAARPSMDARPHQPRRNSDRARQLRSDSDIARERTRRWREKQQQQQAYGWPLWST